MNKERLMKEHQKVVAQIEVLQEKEKNLATQIEDIEKGELWKTSQKLKISASELIELVKLRENENKKLLAERDKEIIRHEETK